jgi:ketosteroid isomerase-like protein
MLPGMTTLEQRYRAGWQALADGRLDDLLDLYAPDVEVRETGRTFRGRDEVRAQYQSWLDALSDIQVEILDVIESGDALAGEVRMTARHTAPLMTPNGPVPATGRTIQMESCDIARFRDGLVVSFHTYFDQLALMAQLGLLGAPQELQAVAD